MKKILLGVLVLTLLLGVSVGIASATTTSMKNAVGYNWFHRIGHPKETTITIYNNGLALVREVYEVELKCGENEIWFGDFPDTVDPSSIRIKSLNTPDDLVVLEQSFEKNISTYPFFGAPISKSFIALVKNHSRPNLTFAMYHKIELSYFVRGITWQVRYRLEVNKSEDVFNFSGRVIITDQSGNPVEYKNAKIKLIAGDVHRVGGRFYTLEEGKAPASRFEEKRFFEYHTYTLDKPTTLKWNETKLIPLFPKISTKLFRNSSAFQKKLIFEGQRSNKVQIWLSFLNSEDNGLGMPLPAGVVQVFKQDTDGQIEFIGEDQIGHTPKDEMINLYIGNAFDIIGERKVLERKQIDTRTWEESIKITLKNHKDEDVKVTVIEHFGGNWEITSVYIFTTKSEIKPLEFPTPLEKGQARTFKKRNACSIEFKPVIVPKNGEAVIIYTVRYKR